jgi:hypothetical protein
MFHSGFNYLRLQTGFNYPSICSRLLLQWSHPPMQCTLHGLRAQKKGSSSPTLHADNCNNFSDELASLLCGRGIPSHITALPSEVLRTPFGQVRVCVRGVLALMWSISFARKQFACMCKREPLNVRG